MVSFLVFLKLKHATWYPDFPGGPPGIAEVLHGAEQSGRGAAGLAARSQR